MSAVILLRLAGLAVGAIAAGVITVAAHYRRRSALKVDSRSEVARNAPGTTLSRCPICKEFMKNAEERTVLPCTCVFHTACIALVFDIEVTGKRTCPSCRKLVSEARVSRIIESAKSK